MVFHVEHWPCSDKQDFTIVTLRNLSRSLEVAREHNAISIETPDTRSNTINGDDPTRTELELPNFEGYMERDGLARRSLPSTFTRVQPLSHCGALTTENGNTLTSSSLALRSPGLRAFAVAI